MAIRESLTGVASNMRSPANQSLQEAAANMQGGGQALGQLAQALQGFSNKAGSLIAEAGRASAEGQMSAAQSVSRGITDGVNQIMQQVDQQRRRKEEMEDWKTRTDITFQKQKDYDAYQRQQANLETAKRAEMEAERQQMLSGVSTQLREAETVRSNYESLTKILEDSTYDEGGLGKYLDLEQKIGFQTILTELVSDRNSHLREQPEEIKEVMKLYGLQYDKELAHSMAEQRSPDYGSLGGHTPGVSDRVNLSENAQKELKEALGRFAQRNPEGQVQQVFDIENVSNVGSLKQLTHSLRFGLINQKEMDERTRREVVNKMAKSALEVSQTAKSWNTALANNGQVLDPIAGPAIMQSLRSSVAKEDLYSDNVKATGNDLYSGMVGEIINRAYPKSASKLLDLKKRYDAGETDSPEFKGERGVGLAVLFTAIDNQIIRTFKDMNGLPSDGSIPEASKRWFSADLSDAQKNELNARIGQAVGKAMGHEGRLKRLPTVREFDEQLGQAKGILLATGSIVGKDFAVAGAPDPDSKGTTSESLDKFINLSRTMREALEAAGRGDVFESMTATLTGEKPLPMNVWALTGMPPSVWDKLPPLPSVLKRQAQKAAEAAQMQQQQQQQQQTPPPQGRTGNPNVPGYDGL